jgi:tripartite-type tricarboxylate transporter receptor subunit TctC
MRPKVFLLMLTLMFFQSLGASAETYPSRVIKMIVSTTPGSSVDVIARIVSQPLSEALNQPVVVETRGGANGQIAAAQVASAQPDGYTFLVTTASTLATNPFLFPDTASTVLSGLDPVTLLVNNELVIAVRPTLGVRSFPDLIQWIRQNPGKLNFATSSRNGALNLAAELLKHTTKLDFTIVPHNGEGVAINSVLGGHTDAIIATTTVIEPFVGNEKLIALATTGEKRSRFIPGIPTASELGYSNFTVAGWIAIVAPKGTPRPIVDRINKELSKIAARPEMQEAFLRLKFNPVFNTPEEFAKFWQVELALWKEVIAASGVRPEK